MKKYIEIIIIIILLITSIVFGTLYLRNRSITNYIITEDGIAKSEESILNEQLILNYLSKNQNFLELSFNESTSNTYTYNYEDDNLEEESRMLFAYLATNNDKASIDYNSQGPYLTLCYDFSYVESVFKYIFNKDIKVNNLVSKSFYKFDIRDNKVCISSPDGLGMYNVILYKIKKSNDHTFEIYLANIDKDYENLYSKYGNYTKTIPREEIIKSNLDVARITLKLKNNKYIISKYENNIEDY